MQNKIRRFEINDEAIGFETDPGYRTIIYNDKNTYHLWFPYMVCIIKYYSGNLKTLHIGMRTCPLNKKNIMEEIIKFPPLSNIYWFNLLACSKANIEDFWNTNFLKSIYWPGEKILLTSGLISFKIWASMPPKMLVPIFCDWPKIIPYYNEIDKTPFISSEFTIADCIAPIYDNWFINHVNGLE